MALVKPFIFQLVGYQNSGKTTFIRNLLAQLKLNGYKVGTIKHHGHGGKPVLIENTDSALHVQAGAFASLVEGGGRIILQVEEDIDWSLDQKIEIISKMNPDIILVEGHKTEGYPKAVFIRDENDLHLLTELNKIELVLTQISLVNNINQHYFHRSDSKAIQWIVDYIECQLKSDENL